MLPTPISWAVTILNLTILSTSSVIQISKISLSRKPSQLNYQMRVSIHAMQAFGSQKDKDRLPIHRELGISSVFHPGDLTELLHSLVPQAIPQDHDRRRRVCPLDSPLRSQQRGDRHSRRAFRTIGINRISVRQLSCSCVSNQPETTGIQWLSYLPMPYNTVVPFYSKLQHRQTYFANTTDKVSTDSFLLG